MKKHAIVAMVLIILFMTPVHATAESILISAPLMSGENGLSCACTNLTKNMIEVRFTIGPNTTVMPIEIASGDVGYFTTFRVGNSPNICKVYRFDGKSVSKKQLKCTLASIDALDNPTVVIPVDTKFKQ